MAQRVPYIYIYIKGLCSDHSLINDNERIMYDVNCFTNDIPFVICKCIKFTIHLVIMTNTTYEEMTNAYLHIFLKTAVVAYKQNVHNKTIIIKSIVDLLIMITSKMVELTSNMYNAYHIYTQYNYTYR